MEFEQRKQNMTITRVVTTIIIGATMLFSSCSGGGGADRAAVLPPVEPTGIRWSGIRQLG